MVHEGFKKRATIIFIGSFLMAAAISFVLILKMVFNIGTLCPFNYFLGVYCPGCGGTRMAVSILHFDFYQAFRYNPFVFCTAPLIAYLYVWQSYEYIFKNKISFWLDKALIAYAILLVVFGITRNIEIFKWLAPTDII